MAVLLGGASVLVAYANIYYMLN